SRVIIRTLSVLRPEKLTELHFADPGANPIALIDGRHDDVSVAMQLPRDTNDGPDDRIDFLVVRDRLDLDFREQGQDVAHAPVDDLAVLAAGITVDAGHAQSRHA